MPIGATPLRAKAWTLTSFKGPPHENLVPGHDGRHVIIKDEITARKGDEIRWAMATSAGIEIAGNKATLSSDNKKLYAHVITPEDASFTLISTKPDNPDEKQNEGTRMLGVYTSAQSSITKIVIILTNDPTENLKPLIPMELSAE